MAQPVRKPSPIDQERIRRVRRLALLAQHESASRQEQEEVQAFLHDVVAERQELVTALREATLCPRRSERRCVEYDPTGSVWAVEWTAQARRWAALCDLDLDQHEPPEP